MKKLVATWGHDKAATEKYNALIKRGEQLIADKQLAAAQVVWEQAAKLRPMDALPHQRLAGLCLSRTINKPLQAADHLILLDKAELKDNRYSKRLARLYQQENDLPKSLDFAARATRINPWDPDARDLFATVLSAHSDTAEAQRQKQVAQQIRTVQAKPANPDEPATAPD